LEKVNTALCQKLRKKSRNPDPTATIVDSQSIKGTPESCLESGFDGGKFIKGRKRNILFDTMGCLIIVRVFAANVFDGKSARQLITDLFSFLHTITKNLVRQWLFWPGAFQFGSGIQFGCLIEVVRKQTGFPGFHVLPRRWVVERTFAWPVRSRRLSKDSVRPPRESSRKITTTHYS